MILTKDLIDMLSFSVIGTECNKAILDYKARDLYCMTVSDDRTMSGAVTYEKFNDGNSFFGSEEVAIPDVTGLIRMLKPLDKTVDTNLMIEGRGERFLVIDDGSLEIKVPLIRKSQVPAIPRIMHEKLDPAKRQNASIDSTFIKQFYKLSGAVKGCKYVYIDRENEKMQVFISETEDYKNGVKMELNQNKNADVFNITKFDMKKVRTLLYNNRNCDRGEIIVDGGMLLTLKFFYEKCAAEFYIVAE